MLEEALGAEVQVGMTSQAADRTFLLGVGPKFGSRTLTRIRTKTHSRAVIERLNKVMAATVGLLVATIRTRNRHGLVTRSKRHINNLRTTTTLNIIRINTLSKPAPQRTKSPFTLSPV